MRRLQQMLTPAIVLVAVAVAACPLASASARDDVVRTADDGDSPSTTPPRILLRTELGDIVVEVDEAAAPATAANFLAHVDEGIYTGAHFYRVVRMDNQPRNEIKIEVIQGGLGFEAESPRPPIAHETTRETGLRHLDGTLSMARLGPGTASSEFFVCIGDQPELDFGGSRNPDGQGFAAFGRVVEGMDVVRAIQQLDDRDQILVEPVAISNMRRVP
jgi:peptidyl-prolyl cis-trans isomerase A (cyclophilin A)